jgi:glycosyltransferase involved in cell wall biosynthesis
MKEERFAWLAQAQLLVLPSPNESLSLATLEGWALGVPSLVNGQAPVLKGHCLRAQGGLYYNGGNEFIAALRQLRSDSTLRSMLGQQGKAYIDRDYRWERIEKEYVAFLRKVYALVYEDSRGRT